MLLEHSPDIYQIAERAQRYVLVDSSCGFLT